MVSGRDMEVTLESESKFNCSGIVSDGDWAVACAECKVVRGWRNTCRDCPLLLDVGTKVCAEEAMECVCLCRSGAPCIGKNKLGCASGDGASLLLLTESVEKFVTEASFG